MRVVKAGTTDVSVVIRIIDSTDGTPETGVVWNTAGIDLEYRREGEVSTDIVEATLAALTTAHTPGGFLHIGNGYYRLDLPDAACAAGATGVLIHGTVTGMVVIGEYIQLVAYDPFDASRLGLTALPDALPGVVGGGLTLAQQAGYPGGCIWFDTGGAAGDTAYVNGIVTNPVSSPTNAHTLLTTLNLKLVHVVNASNYTVEATYNGYSFVGDKWTLLPSGQQLINCYFEGATITSGTFHANSTGCHFNRCLLDTVSLSAGNTAVASTRVSLCGLSGTITCVAAGRYFFEKSFSSGPAGTSTTIDFGAALGVTTIRISDWDGNLEIANMKAGDVLVLGGRGAVTLAASCTAGTVYIRGTLELVNSGSGQTIYDTSRWNEDQSVATVTDSVGQTGDNYARLGAPAGASVSADILALKTETEVIVANTNVDIPTTLTEIIGYVSPGIADLATAVADIPSNAELTAAFTEIKGATWAATDTLEAIRDRVDVSITDIAAVKAETVLIVEDTGTTLPGTLTTIAGYLDTEIAAILEDTGTTLPALIASEISDALTVDALVDGKTITAALQIIAAVTAGKITTAGAADEIFLGLDGLTTRVTATVDVSGNRNPVVYG